MRYQCPEAKRWTVYFIWEWWKPAMVAHTHNPGKSGGWGRRISKFQGQPHLGNTRPSCLNIKRTGDVVELYSAPGFNSQYWEGQKSLPKNFTTYITSYSACLLPKSILMREGITESVCLDQLGSLVLNWDRIDDCGREEGLWSDKLQHSDSVSKPELLWFHCSIWHCCA